MIRWYSSDANNACIGSAAAAIQSTYGGYIAAGSWFALSQSAAMGGVAVAGPAVLALGSAMAAGGTGLLIRMGLRPVPAPL